MWICCKRFLLVIVWWRVIFILIWALWYVISTIAKSRSQSIYFLFKLMNFIVFLLYFSIIVVSCIVKLHLQLLILQLKVIITRLTILKDLKPLLHSPILHKQLSIRRFKWFNLLFHFSLLRHFVITATEGVVRVILLLVETIVPEVVGLFVVGGLLLLLLLLVLVVVGLLLLLILVVVGLLVLLLILVIICSNWLLIFLLFPIPFNINHIFLHHLKHWVVIWPSYLHSRLKIVNFFFSL